MRKLRGYIGLFVMILTGLILSMTAMASSLSIEVPVTITVEGAAPSTPEDYVINLKADDASFPMPSGASDGLYQTTVTGADSKKLAISFERVGIYTYTIYQTAGDAANGIYDTTVYTMTVTINNPEVGDGLESVVALHTEALSTKPDAASFVNNYKPSDLTVVKALINQGTGKDGSFVEGDIVRYTITVTNTGETDLTDITVKEQLSGATIAEQDGITLNESKTVATITSLKKGESIMLQVSYEVTAADTTAGGIKNVVTTTFKAPGQDDPTDIPSNTVVTKVVTPQKETETETETESEEESESESETEKPKKSNKTNETEKATGSVKTGDETPIGLWIAVLALAGVAVIVLVILRRRSSTRE